jgi:hypothetical protein
VLTERADEFAVDDLGAEVAGVTQLMHELGPVSIREVDALGQQPDEFLFHLPKREETAAVEVSDGVDLHVPQWFAAVLPIPGDDVPVEPTGELVIKRVWWSNRSEGIRGSFGSVRLSNGMR